MTETIGRQSNNVKMSIVVPCYKAEQYLPRCLDSLVAQTMPDLEIITVNDGSPDGCLEIMSGYADRYPGIVRVVTHPNMGMYQARWTGIDVARGEYVGFVDSDDWVDPDFAVNLYNAAVQNDADIAVCGYLRTDLDTGKVLSDEMGDTRPCIQIGSDPGTLLAVNSAVWNKCYRRDVLTAMFRESKRLPTLEDVIFNMCAYLQSHGKVAFTGFSSVHYMVHGDSSINNTTLEQIESVKETLASVRKHYQGQGVPTNLLEYVDAYAFLHLGVAMAFRFSADPSVNLGQFLQETTAYLDENFPTWGSSPYINSRYAKEHGGGALSKLAIAQRFYKMGLMRPFLACYRFAINTLHIDIKW